MDTIQTLILQEEIRQLSTINLVASENIAPTEVVVALGSMLTNKYSEGTPRKRYYGGNEIIDKIEELCQFNALTAYHLNSDEWHVNVQPYSGSGANFAIYTALLQPNDTILSLEVSHGGHISHGLYGQIPLSVAAKYFNVKTYRTIDGNIDYDDMMTQASMYMPRLLIVGGSACPKDWDYIKARHIADSVGAYLMVDMSHYAGLVASGHLNSPFEYADVVMSTTHKTLAGPRGAVIWCKKALKKQIDRAVFPMCQGGPHNHVIAAKAITFAKAQTEQFTAYASKVLELAKVLERDLLEKGWNELCETETHLLLFYMDKNAKKYEEACAQIGLVINANMMPGDVNAVHPSGVRFGTAWLASRGCDVEDIHAIADILHDVYRTFDGPEWQRNKSLHIANVARIVYRWNNKRV